MGTLRYATGCLFLVFVACSGGGQIDSATGDTRAGAASTGGAGHGGTTVASGSNGQGGALVSEKTIDPICVPGETQACLGPGQCPGAQACGARGVSWGDCDCGTTASMGGTTATGGTTSSMGGTTSSMGGTTSSMGGTTSSMGGTRSSSSTVPSTTTACGSVVAPTAVGSLSITGNYVTVGPLKGMGFTWMGSKSNVATCIAPTCSASSCSPSFGMSAICAAGNVGADTTYNSVVGLGVNINQISSGTVGSVSVASGVTVTVVKGTADGDAAARIQITSGATSWCVEAGSWESGTLIPITSFNTECWDNTGTFAPPGTAIDAVHVVIASNPATALPFSLCITNISVS